MNPYTRNVNLDGEQFEARYQIDGGEIEIDYVFPKPTADEREEIEEHLTNYHRL